MVSCSDYVNLPIKILSCVHPLNMGSWLHFVCMLAFCKKLSQQNVCFINISWCILFMFYVEFTVFWIFLLFAGSASSDYDAYLGSICKLCSLMVLVSGLQFVDCFSLFLRLSSVLQQVFLAFSCIFALDSLISTTSYFRQFWTRIYECLTKYIFFPQFPIMVGLSFYMSDLALLYLLHYWLYYLKLQDDLKTTDKRAMCSCFCFSSIVPEFEPISVTQKGT